MNGDKMPIWLPEKKCHSLSNYYIPGTILSTLHALPHLQHLQVAVMNATYINERIEILEGYGEHTHG